MGVCAEVLGGGLHRGVACLDGGQRYSFVALGWWKIERARGGWPLERQKI